MEQYFIYGTNELEYLKMKDKRLGAVIDKVGMIERTIIPDLFSSLVYSIIGQQISTKAHKAIWLKMQEKWGKITPALIESLSVEELQSIGTTFRKVDYIKSIAHQVFTNEFNIEELYGMNDTDICKRLSSLKGIGVWTAEMMMLFSMQRPNILSYGDLAILRGMRMVYHHRNITPELFNKYKRRLSPYCSIASLYFWTVASGKVDGYTDYIVKNKTNTHESRRKATSSVKSH